MKWKKGEKFVSVFFFLSLSPTFLLFFIYFQIVVYLTNNIFWCDIFAPHHHKQTKLNEMRVWAMIVVLVMMVMESVNTHQTAHKFGM